LARSSFGGFASSCLCNFSLFFASQVACSSTRLRLLFSFFLVVRFPSLTIPLINVISGFSTQEEQVVWEKVTNKWLPFAMVKQ